MRFEVVIHDGAKLTEFLKIIISNSLIVVKQAHGNSILKDCRYAST